MEMKPLSLSVVLLITVSFFGISPQVMAEGPEEMLSSLDEQIIAIKRLEELSRNGAYSEIYAMLDSEYSQSVGKEFFAKVATNLRWRLTNVQVGTVERFDAFAYAPVRAIVAFEDQKRVRRIDAVVFLKKRADGWRLLNFPFLQPELPNFATIPAWVAPN